MSDEIADQDALAIADLAVAELARRLKDPVQASELPASALFSVLNAQAKARDREAEERARKAKEPDRGTGVELILNMDIPDEQRKRLLQDEKKKLQQQLALVDKHLEGQ